MRLTVEIDLDIDEALWAAEYGIPADDVAADVLAYVEPTVWGPAVAKHATDMHLFGPIPKISGVRVDTDGATVWLIEILGEGMLAAEVGPKLTCMEANAIAGFLRAHGETGAADAWIEGHADGDDEGDEHWQGSESGRHGA